MSRRRVRDYRRENACRDSLGVIATLDDGSVINRLNVSEVCDHCDALGLRIVSLSSWRTIYADITTSRTINDPNHRGSYVKMPEWDMLSNVNRRDLLVEANARV